MIRLPRRGRAAAGALYAIATVLLLRRMRHELLAHGRLSPLTVAWMYAIYVTHTAVTIRMLYRYGNTMGLPPAASRAGSVLAAGGTSLYLAGIRRFAGPGQLSGTDTCNQITGGIYRYSRNPQYTGIVLALAGMALARRSGASLILAVATGVAYRWWMPTEEAHLESAFGQHYLTYRDYTPRWLGLPRATSIRSRYPGTRY